MVHLDKETYERFIYPYLILTFGLGLAGLSSHEGTSIRSFCLTVSTFFFLVGILAAIIWAAYSGAFDKPVLTPAKGAENILPPSIPKETSFKLICQKQMEFLAERNQEAENNARLLLEEEKAKQERQRVLEKQTRSFEAAVNAALEEF